MSLVGSPSTRRFSADARATRATSYLWWSTSLRSRRLLVSRSALASELPLQVVARVFVAERVVEDEHLPGDGAVPVR
jgi:hypothetical protein